MAPPRLAWLSLLLALGCGAEPTSDQPAPSAAPTAGGKADGTSPLDRAVVFWESFAPLCEGRPSKEDCDDGDMTLFSGLLCAAGDARGCASVRASQGDDGRFWRSPRRVGGNLGQGNSFSRDMSLGVMLYLATTRDTGAAERWVHWIDQNRPCVVTNPFTGRCLSYGLHRMCRDDSDHRCTMTPGTWALLGRVYDHLGLPRNGLMRDYEGADGDWEAIELRANDPGYEMHLKAVAVLLKQVMNQSRAPRQELAEMLAERQPGNPFFVYLRDGATDAVRSRLLEVCPREEAGTGFGKRQWAWERDTAGEAWRESMGWDCLFLAQLLR